MAAQTIASPMPVLPLVASTTVCPGLSSPARSAASITPSARRSLTEPIGLKASSLAWSSTPSGASRFSRTTGVRPTVARMLSFGPGIAVLRLSDRYTMDRRGGPANPAEAFDMSRGVP